MMGRIRTIKPEFFTHEELFDLEEETGLPVRIAFAGLWTICDREGRFKWRPRSIKSQIMPYDSLDFARVLDALVTRGFVVRYASSGVEYGYVPGFSRHQIVNFRESASVLPDPPNLEEMPKNTTFSRVVDACPTRAEHVDNAACGEWKGREQEGKGTGKEQERSVAALPRVPESPKRRRPSVAIQRPDDIAESHWRDWTSCRRKPVTESVMTRIRREAAKAGISADDAIRTAAERQWEGFQAEWLATDRQLSTERKPSQPMTFGQLKEKNRNDVFERVFASGKVEAIFDAVERLNGDEGDRS